MVEAWHQPTAASAPFGAVLEAAGFELSGASVSEPGGWENYAAIEQMVAVATRHASHLDERNSRSLTGLLDAFSDWRDDPSYNPDPLVLSRLQRSPETALCLEAELVRVDPHGQHLVGFFDAFDRPSGTVAGVLDTLRSLAADLAGDGAAAEALVDAAALAAPDWYPAIEGRIRFLELRGRSREALNLLQRIRMPDDPELQVMRNRNRAATPSVGRNEPCPCGSGRKFKQCHQGKNVLPADVRVMWLLDKARTHLDRFGPMALVDDLPVASSPVENAHLVALDVALFERGGLEGFLESRRAMLPPEDVALLERWVSRHRPSVYRVDAIDDDEMLLTDEATDTTYPVHRTGAFADRSLHDLVWCRLLPDAGRWWCSGIVRATAAWTVGTDRSAVEALLDEATERQGSTWIVGDGDEVAATITLVDPPYLSLHDDDFTHADIWGTDTDPAQPTRRSHQGPPGRSVHRPTWRRQDAPHGRRHAGGDRPASGGPDRLGGTPPGGDHPGRANLPCGVEGCRRGGADRPGPGHGA